MRFILTILPLARLR